MNNMDELKQANLCLRQMIEKLQKENKNLKDLFEKVHLEGYVAGFDDYRATRGCVAVTSDTWIKRWNKSRYKQELGI